MKNIIKLFSTFLLANFITNSQAVEITVWEDTYVSSSIKQAAEDFYKLTGTKVNFENGNYIYALEKLRLDGPAGVGPDIILLPNDQIGQAVKEGMIVPVEFEDDEELNEEELVDDDELADEELADDMEEVDEEPTDDEAWDDDTSDTNEES